MNTYAQRPSMQGIATKQPLQQDAFSRTQTSRPHVVRKQRQSRVSSVQALTLPFTNINITQAVFGVFALSIALYLYMVVSIVVATVDRKGFEERVREQTTELSFRETDYSQKIGGITVASAYDAGFISAESQFTNKVEGTALTLNQ